MLAVVVWVAGAFFGTGLAGEGAEVAGFFGEVAVADHQGFGEAAEVGAVAVEADAGGHHRHVVLAQAGCGAMLAGDDTGAAGLDA